MAVTYVGDAANTLVIETRYGLITIDLLPDVAPNHVQRIADLTRAGEYNDVAWHRIVDGFVAQTGDVQFGDMRTGFDQDNVGRGGSSLPDVDLEPSDISYVRGVVGAARGDNPNSFNSQFFITTDDATFLDTQYTVFGIVSDGMQFVDQLSLNPTLVPIDPDTNIQTNIPDRMIEVFIADDIAPGRTSVGTVDGETLTGGARNEAFLGLSGDDSILAKGGDDWIAAGDGDDTVNGGKGDDEVHGGRGADDIATGGGADSVFGGLGSDKIKTGAGADSLSGDVGKDTLNGGGGSDSLEGGTQDDLLRGGGGADSLDGGQGNDVLLGGKGRDSFVFTGETFGSDTIKGGFDLGRDMIDLRGVDVATLGLTVGETGGDTVLSFTNGNAQILIEGVTGLMGSENDFILI